MNYGEISGNTADNGGGVLVGNGNFVMHDGKIRGNTAEQEGGGVKAFTSFTMHNGEISGNIARHGGGIRVSTSNQLAHFTMLDGKINENTATQSGGGLFIGSGTFTMHGGEINDNTASTSGGGVRSEANFIMHDGEISGNTAGTEGGGIIANHFTMHDGEITNNTADIGGGVHARRDSTMHNGIIENNNARNGGGVAVNAGLLLVATFTMHDGSINENTATERGGGVYVWRGIFTMMDGEIIGNEAGTHGGGINARNLGRIIMYDGEISGNTAEGEGGGVRADWTFTMHDGEISGNTAYNGGGVRIYGVTVLDDGNNPVGVTSYFTMNGGVITENNAKNNGGGLFLWGGTLRINAGMVSNNIANNGGGIFMRHDNGYIQNAVIESGAILTGNVARHGLFINDEMAMENPQIVPGTVSIPSAHAFTNYDINILMIHTVTFAVRNGVGGTLEAGGDTVTGTQIGEVDVDNGEEVSFTAAPASGWEIEAWYINNVRQTGPITNILDYIAIGAGPHHIEVLFIADPVFNLALRTFISEVETNGTVDMLNRAPIVSMPSVFAGELIYTFPIDKSVNPVRMTNGSILTQTIRIFNEGTIAGYVNEIMNDIPAGLEFLPMHSTNLNYEWVMYDVSGQVTTDASEAVEIRTRYLENNQIDAFDPDLGVIAGNPDYRDIQVAFRVTYEGGTGRIIVSRSEIYDAEAFGGGTVGYINLLDEENDTEYMYVVRTDVGNNGNGDNNGSNDDGEVKGEYRPENDNQGKGNAVSTNDPISSVRYIVLIAMAMISLIVLLKEKRK
ncbi:MAG: hypothetical protein FWC79_03475 [Oscillospiraceae bacterium]|nr:hypothetical protein [Oscillospiraceae bacterium]